MALRPLFCLFLSVLLRQVSLYMYFHFDSVLLINTCKFQLLSKSCFEQIQIYGNDQTLLQLNIPSIS